MYFIYCIFLFANSIDITITQNRSTYLETVDLFIFDTSFVSRCSLVLVKKRNLSPYDL